jgi:hypothetical protein
VIEKCPFTGCSKMAPFFNSLLPHYDPATKKTSPMQTVIIIGGVAGGASAAARILKQNEFECSNLSGVYTTYALVKNG